MLDISKIKGIIFDYGGTIDSNGEHWSEVLWKSYQENHVPINKEEFREAYVYAERYLATNLTILPEYNFLDVLETKVSLQIKYMISKSLLKLNNNTKQYIANISKQCYIFVKNLISNEKLILEKLHDKYPIVLVSNFYGNINAVLENLEISNYFDAIIESAVVGIRKPNPEIFRLGVEELNLPAESVVVIGDSYTKDIVPATQIGCKTIWLKGIGWEKDDVNAKADVIITDFMELKKVFTV